MKIYEKWRKPQKVDFEDLVGVELYKQHWGNWEELLSLMEKAQKVAVAVRQAASMALDDRGKKEDSSL